MTAVTAKTILSIAASKTPEFKKAKSTNQSVAAAKAHRTMILTDVARNYCRKDKCAYSADMLASTASLIARYDATIAADIAMQAKRSPVAKPTPTHAVTITKLPALAPKPVVDNSPDAKKARVAALAAASPAHVAKLEADKVPVKKSAKPATPVTPTTSLEQATAERKARIQKMMPKALKAA